MIELEDSIKIDIPIEEIWDRFYNIELLPEIFPEIEKVEVIDRENYRAYIWFKTKLGITTLRLKASSEIIEYKENEFIISRVKSKHIEIQIEFVFTKIDNNITIIKYRLAGEAKDIIGKMLENKLRKLLINNRDKIKNSLIKILR